MHGHQRHALPFLAAGFSCLLCQHFLVSFHVLEPFVNTLILFGILLDLFQDCHQLFRLHLPIRGVFTQVFVISHTFSDILDGRIWRLITDHLHIPLQLVNAVLHPRLVTVKIPQSLISDLAFAHAVTSDIPVRTVGDLKEIFAFLLSLSQMKITTDIRSDKMLVDIIQVLFHRKWNLILHQSL